jgi:hypothetical protein
MREDVNTGNKNSRIIQPEEMSDGDYRFTKTGTRPITILHLSGALDGTTYQTLIEKAKHV